MTFPRITTLFYVNRQQSEKLFKELSKIISTSFYKAKDYAESTRGRPRAALFAIVFNLTRNHSRLIMIGL